MSTSLSHLTPRLFFCGVLFLFSLARLWTSFCSWKQSFGREFRSDRLNIWQLRVRFCVVPNVLCALWFKVMEVRNLLVFLLVYQYCVSSWPNSGWSCNRRKINAAELFFFAIPKQTEIHKFSRGPREFGEEKWNSFKRTSTQTPNELRIRYHVMDYKGRLYTDRAIRYPLS